ncbi:hypothetical protein CDD83_9225 [Cordyceps sp. RAO-2017]|nr:hypothetical protein CDD83_9225 [Cordyceps sp. RAO-2017]
MPQAEPGSPRQRQRAASPRLASPLASVKLSSPPVARETGGESGAATLGRSAHGQTWKNTSSSRPLRRWLPLKASAPSLPGSPRRAVLKSTSALPRKHWTH